MKHSISNKPAPWWKFGHVWMVIAGPAIVVVAGLITLYLALTRPDPVVNPKYYQQGTKNNQTIEARDEADVAAKAASLAPANQARNHAQTGVKPPSAGSQQ